MCLTVLSPVTKITIIIGFGGLDHLESEVDGLTKAIMTSRLNFSVQRRAPAIYTCTQMNRIKITGCRCRYSI